jgi:hypothetical protein
MEIPLSLTLTPEKRSTVGAVCTSTVPTRTASTNQQGIKYVPLDPIVTKHCTLRSAAKRKFKSTHVKTPCTDVAPMERILQEETMMQVVLLYATAINLAPSLLPVMPSRINVIVNQESEDSSVTG